MATAITKTKCSVCINEISTFMCRGCSKDFCFDHLTEHRQSLKEQFHHIQNNYNLFRETLIDQKNHPETYVSVQKIEQWRNESVQKINQTADKFKRRLINYTNKYLSEIEDKLNGTIQLTISLNDTDKNDTNEIDLRELTNKLNELKEELDKSSNIIIEQQATSFISNISIVIPIANGWEQNGITVAGGNGPGKQLDQLHGPASICIDDEQSIYVADWENHRIIEWKPNTRHGRIVAGGNSQGNQTNQLSEPLDVIIDKQMNSLIISDYRNTRVMRWSLQNNTNNGEVIISNIDCCRLAMDNNGGLYVSDHKKHEVRRLKRGETNGTIIAGGNGQGAQLNQLNHPMHIFVDENESLYISDRENHRVVKWLQDAKEGIIVAGGNGRGNSMAQLSYPQGVVVDQWGQIYVADLYNHRVMRWCEGDKEGTVVVGGHGQGEEPNQLNYPKDLSLAQEENLHVVDHGNHRIQKFVALNKF